MCLIENISGMTLQPRCRFRQAQYDHHAHHRGLAEGYAQQSEGKDPGTTLSSHA